MIDPSAPPPERTIDRSQLPPLNNVLDLLLDVVCLVDAEGQFVFVSAAAEQVFGYKPEELVGRRMQSMIHPDDLERTLKVASEVVKGRALSHFENRYIRKDGQVVHIMWSARWSESDKLRIAVARDVSERKRADFLQGALYAISEAAFSAEDLVSLFGRVHRIIDGLLLADNFFVALYDETSGNLSYPYFADEKMEAPAPHVLVSDSSLSAEIIRSGNAILLDPDGRAPDREPKRADLGPGAVHWLGVPLVAPRGIIGVLAVQNYDQTRGYGEKDIGLLQFVSTQVASAIERKRMETRLQHAALYDHLTELPNRVLFYDRMQSALALARRDNRRVTLLYLDLDDFKEINDTHGHAVGDLLLKEVAKRLNHCVRESDTVGRVGGDEFLVLLNGTTSEACAMKVADKIRDSLNQPMQVGDLVLKWSASLGLASFPEHGDEHHKLIRYADEAMYRAKRQGGNRVERALVKAFAGETRG